MASRPLVRVRGLREDVVEALRLAGVDTARDLFMASPLKVMQCADVSMEEWQSIVRAVSQAIVPEPITALHSLRERASKQRFLETNFPDLDKALQGGVLMGTLTDVCGQPGVGKTQFCIGCVVQAHIAGGGVVYIDTEHKFDPVRLVQIATESFPSLFSASFRADASHRVDALLSAVKVLRPSSVDGFKQTIAQLQEIVIAENVSLIVIDSIAALLRKEGLDERQKEAFVMTQAGDLKRLAEACHCAVLASNQVTPLIAQDAADAFGDAIYSGQLAYVPTLGAVWHHCVSTRLTMALELSEEAPGGAAGVGQVQGQVAVTKSPIAAATSLAYCIGPRGLQSR